MFIGISILRGSNESRICFRIRMNFEPLLTVFYGSISISVSLQVKIDLWGIVCLSSKIMTTILIASSVLLRGSGAMKFCNLLPQILLKCYCYYENFYYIQTKFIPIQEGSFIIDFIIAVRFSRVSNKITWFKLSSLDTICNYLKGFIDLFLFFHVKNSIR